MFPNINIPAVSVVWTYTGLLLNYMSGRGIYYYERTLTSQAGDIESQSLNILQLARVTPADKVIDSPPGSLATDDAVKIADGAGSRLEQSASKDEQ